MRATIISGKGTGRRIGERREISKLPETLCSGRNLQFCRDWVTEDDEGFIGQYTEVCFFAATIIRPSSPLEAIRARTETLILTEDCERAIDAAFPGTR